MSVKRERPGKDGQSNKRRSGTAKVGSKAQQRFAAGYLFRKVARELVPIEADGKRTRLSYWDAYVRQIYAMALNKNNTASRLLDQLRRTFPGDALPGDPITFLITKEDAML